MNKDNLSWRLRLHLLKKTLWYRYFLTNVEKHLTTILQFSWMNNLIIQKQSFTDFLKIALFKTFAIFTEKHLYRNFFLITPYNWSLVFWVKQDSSTGVSSEYWQIFKNSFFIKKLPVAASYYSFYEHLLFEISNDKRVLLIEMIKFSSSRSKLVLLNLWFSHLVRKNRPNILVRQRIFG